MTLEVLEGYEGAKACYEGAGFRGYELDPRHGRALLWEKKLQIDPTKMKKKGFWD